jgi:hypothetical protein
MLPCALSAYRDLPRLLFPDMLPSWEATDRSLILLSPETIEVPTPTIPPTTALLHEETFFTFM